MEINYIKMSKKTKIIHLENYQKKSYPIKKISFIFSVICLCVFLIFLYLKDKPESKDNTIVYGDGNIFIDLTQEP